MLTQERLKELLHYDPDTGIFTRMTSTGGVKIGSVAGANHSRGYLQCSIDGKLYLCHRLAWLYITGEFPLDQIDHISGNKKDNRILNLRDVNNTTNQQNIKTCKSNNKLVVLGVHSSRGKFKAEIRINGKKKQLGHFQTPELANAAYLEAKRKHHEGCTI